MHEGKNIIVCDDAEHATILAALRFYQEEGMGDPDNRSDDIHDIATNNDEIASSLNDEGVDELAEKINGSVDIVEALPALKEAGLNFGDCISEFGVSSDEDPFARAADENFHSDGDIEIDGTTVVSRGDDYEGAYVLAWKWVSAEDAGIYRPSEHIDHILCAAFDARQDMTPSNEVNELQLCADVIEKIVGNHSDQIDDYRPGDFKDKILDQNSFSETTDDGRVIEISPFHAMDKLIKLIQSKGRCSEETSLSIEFVESNAEEIGALLSKLNLESK